MVCPPTACASLEVAKRRVSSKEKTISQLDGVDAQSVAKASAQGTLRFIDLFAGLGGFHLALKRLGHEAVFACEIDEKLRQLYKRNFGLHAAGDIRTLALEADIPEHDVLCAGFPCQPFSKAGEQQGTDCPKWGDLFSYVLQILHVHKPHYVLLENVANLERHDGGRTWKAMEEALRAEGYPFVDKKRLSPHHFGIPQIRDRLFVVASRAVPKDFSWPETGGDLPETISPILDDCPPSAMLISERTEQCLNTWQEFLDQFPKDEDLPTFPIWSMEFGADYPYERTTPWQLGRYRLKNYRGSHGKSLCDVKPVERLAHVPSYAQAEAPRFPNWKVQFIRQNRELYQRHKGWIDPWLPKIRRFPPSLQKLEWNCKGCERDIWQYIIQFRASGVRVKRPTTAPSLIAMTTTQVPIVAWQKRYMTPAECARLQSMDVLRYLPTSRAGAFRALGNAVNVKVVELVAARLLRCVQEP